MVGRATATVVDATVVVVVRAVVVVDAAVVAGSVATVAGAVVVVTASVVAAAVAAGRAGGSGVEASRIPRYQTPSPATATAIVVPHIQKRLLDGGVGLVMVVLLWIV
ncbi:MAG: hypothetical protein OXF41_02035 [bacterium]|nr:hypothetical protein [bacterium]